MNEKKEKKLLKQGELLVIAKEYEKAMKLFRRVAKTGSLAAQCWIARVYMELGDYERGWYLFQDAKEKGCLDGDWGIATCYYKGWYAAKDEAKAARLWADTAEKGQGVPQSYVNAMKWYSLASGQNYADAAKRYEDMKILAPKELFRW